MYLPNKIIKILSNINKSYIIYYTKGKISSVIIDSENIKIEACSRGYCINLKGSQVILNDLKSLQPLLLKVGISNKSTKMKIKLKIEDSLVELFSKNENTFAAKYCQGNIISIIMDEPQLYINKTSVGYLLKVNNKSIAAESFSAIKKLLVKMQIIEEKNKKSREKNEIHFEQLKLKI
ncbi:hypothetical protein [Romboutsia sp.]|uniref:hypothetical protein n=1 Tax=Romboutsia sp. TaxID=1965302 RepID=UPI002B879466|nr:hypothetical protein [Romboutsia sp.]HSQ90442.1 hypothetical protein [Romboutsia sp.]